MLEISLLGPLQIHLDGIAVDNLSTSKTQALLGYLAAENRQMHRREKLAGLLWPNFAESAARVNLRQTLKLLRQLVPAKAISASRLEIGFISYDGSTLDTVSFINQVARYREQGDIDALKQAVQLYRGEFLEQLWLNDCTAFEEWLLLKREWLRREMQDALYHLAAYALANHHFDEAIRYAFRQIEIDSLNEPAYIQLIKGLAQTGRSAEALQHFERFRYVLQEELATTPSNVLLALVHQIRAHDVLPLIDSEIQAPESLPTVASTTNNLPRQSTPLLGRDREISELLALVKDNTTRLTTVVGPGGIGKTRLALTVAAEIINHTVFVPLQSVETADAIAPAIADAINFHFTAGAAPQEQLRNYLQPKKMLLLLDNFEHLLDGIEFLIDLLHACPQLRFLITSRERLNLHQEQVFTLEGLVYPEHEKANGDDYPAVTLFVQTARRVRHNFAARAVELAQIATICQHVEGMPLAIELAAGWVNVLPVAEIAEMVEGSLDVFSSSVHDLPDRHRNMRNVFDFTWQRMSGREQTLFAKLSIFQGGFTRTAAEEIADASMQRLAILVNKSLIRYDPAQDRYSLHELLRQYGQEKLEAAAEERVATKERHSDHYLSLLAEGKNALEALAQPIHQTTFVTEYENICQAWEWAITHKCASWLQNSVNAFGLLCMHMSRHHEAAKRFKRAVQNWENQVNEERANDLYRYVYAQLLTWCGNFACLLGQNSSANSLLNQSLHILDELCRTEIDIQGARARALYCLGDAATGKEVFAYYEQALATAQSIGDRWLEASVLRALSLYHLAESTDSLIRIQRVNERSLKIHREINDVWGISWNLETIGTIAINRGTLTEGLQAIDECLQIRQWLGNKNDIARCQRVYGNLALLAGDFKEAIARYSESLAIWMDLNLPSEIVFHKCDLALALLYRGKYTSAKVEITEALQLCKQHSDISFPIERVYYILGLLALVDGYYIDAERYLNSTVKLTSIPFLRVFALSGLTVSRRELGFVKDAQNLLEEVLQTTCRTQRYFMTLHALSSASLLLADAGEIEYALELFESLKTQPFNAHSHWFTDVIGLPFEHMITNSALKQCSYRVLQTSEWICRTKEKCKKLSESLNTAAA